MSERHRELQRLQISREAVRLFRAQGVAATSGEQIAEALGLSGRTLWRYFRSKESCVEPLLSFTVDGFVDRLRRWPADRPLEEHLAADRPADPDALPGDDDAALAVIAMARTEPALRAIWLVLYERAVPVLAEVIAGRLGRSPQELAVRVQAAALAAALRIATEDAAAEFVEGRALPREAAESRLAAAAHAATHGVLGDSLSRIG
jgi:AcrR family transcriptional regulator